MVICRYKRRENQNGERKTQVVLLHVVNLGRAAPAGKVGRQEMVSKRNSQVGINGTW